MAKIVSPRMGVPTWENDTPDGPTRGDFNDAFTNVENRAAVYVQSTAATRPGPGTAGRYHYATDTGALSYDTGSAWVTLVNAAGAVGGDGGTYGGTVTIDPGGVWPKMAATGASTSPASYPDGISVMMVSGESGWPTSTGTTVTTIAARGPTARISQLFLAVDGRLWSRTRNAADSSWNAFRRVWSSGDQGPGTGMDADLVDGLHASAFALQSHGHGHGELTGLGSDHHTQYILVNATRAFTSTPRVNSNNIWHEGNQGPNSGMNADLVDGLHAHNMPRLVLLSTTLPIDGQGSPGSTTQRLHLRYSTTVTVGSNGVFSHTLEGGGFPNGLIDVGFFAGDPAGSLGQVIPRGPSLQSRTTVQGVARTTTGGFVSSGQVIRIGIDAIGW